MLGHGGVVVVVKEGDEGYRGQGVWVGAEDGERV